MNALIIALYVIIVLVSLLLIGLILVQQSKGGGGLGGTFGGMGESVFGARAAGHLSKLTVVMTTLFFVLILLLAVLTSHRGHEGIQFSKGKTTSAPVQPAPSANPTVPTK